jgi:hypothetical protein
VNPDEGDTITPYICPEDVKGDMFLTSDDICLEWTITKTTIECNAPTMTTINVPTNPVAIRPWNALTTYSFTGWTITSGCISGMTYEVDANFDGDYDLRFALVTTDLQSDNEFSFTGSSNL